MDSGFQEKDGILLYGLRISVKERSAMEEKID